MSSDSPFETTVEAVFTALNRRDEAELRARCTPDAFAQLAALMAASDRQFTRFPMAIANDSRAAIRGMTLLGDATPEPLWLGFERAGGWRCTTVPASREAAQAWLASCTDPAAVNEWFATVAQALSESDSAALRRLTHPDWQSHPAGAERLAQTLPPGTEVELAGAPRSLGARAIAPLSFGDGATTWLAAQQNGKNLALLTQLDEVGAMVWLRGDTAVLPVWSNLPEDTRAHQLAETVVRAIGTSQAPPPGADLAAWAILTEPVPAGLEPHVGVTRAIPDMNRAALQIRLVEPSDPDWTEEERWGYLERDAADGPWRIRHAAASGRTALLLDGVTSQPMTPPTTSGPDLSQVFGGIAREFTGRATRAAAADDGVVDLAQERARRGSAPSQGPDLGDLLKRAFADAVKTDSSGEPASVDADVLRERGPEIATALFGALTRALVPDNVSVDVPEHLRTTEDGEKAPSRVDLDIGSLVGSLFEAARTPPRPPSSDDNNDEDTDA